MGAVERARMITGEGVRPGQVIVGIGSDGLHTNGFSLARAVLLPPGAATGATVQRALARVPRGLSEPLGDALLRPHRPYARVVLPLRQRMALHGIAHITGGGIPGNLVRMLPDGCRARIHRGRWPVPPIFALIQQRGKIADGEMFRTFNMGLGLLLIVSDGDADSAVAHLERSGERAWIVGDVIPGPREVDLGG